MLQNNSYTGAIFLIGIFYNSIMLGIAALVGSVVSTLTANILGIDREHTQTGFFDFNGVLIGIGLLYFLEPSLITWGYVILATASSTVVMGAMLNIVKTWNIPTLTAPFIITILLFVLACARFGQLHVTGALPSAGLPHISVGVEGVVTFSTVINGTFAGISQVFYQGDVITGLIFIIGLAVSSRTVCLAALIGSFAGVLIAWWMGAEEAAIRAGAYGFNNVLTAIVFDGGLYLVN